MQLRTLGKSSVEVPTIGLGTVKIGRMAGLKYPAAQMAHGLPDDAQVLALLREAAKLGVSLIDTAPAYGLSEQRLGELLYRIQPRNRWVLSSKVGEEFSVDPSTGAGVSRYEFSPEAITTSIERSLKRLKTDYLDIALLHFSSSVDDELVLSQHDAYNTLASLQAQGKVRAIGASTASLAGGIIATQRCEVAMLTFSPTERRDTTALIEARSSGCGILIKKALDSGHIAEPTEPGQSHPPTEPVQAALRLVLAEPAVNSVIVGTTNPKHLLQAVLIAEAVRGE